MYVPLALCPCCRRHVRVTDAGCPFCGLALPDGFAGTAAPDTALRLSRAAAYAFGVALAASGCGATVNGGDSGPQDTGTIQPPYGLPPTDSGPQDTGTIQPPYGLPPEDSGPPDTGNVGDLYGVPTDAGPQDTGAVLPPYGVPPEDSGPPDTGAIMGAYGLPPADAGDASSGVLYGVPPPPDAW